MDTDLLARIFSDLDDAKTLQTVESTCVRWRRAVTENDHVLWRRVALARFPIHLDPIKNRQAALPRSFRTWKTYYGNHNIIAAGHPDFFSMNESFIIHKAGWNDIRDRTIAAPCRQLPGSAETEHRRRPRRSRHANTNKLVSHITSPLLTTNAAIDGVSHLHGNPYRLRPLMIWPERSEHVTIMALDASTIYWIEFNVMDMDAPQTATSTRHDIFALDLDPADPSSARYTLGSHTADVIEISGNGVGILASLDAHNCIHVWNLRSRTRRMSIRLQNQNVSSIITMHLHGNILGFVCENGKVHVWDIEQKVAMVSFDLPVEFAFGLRGAATRSLSEVHVVVRDRLVGIGVAEGTFLIYEITASSGSMRERWFKAARTALLNGSRKPTGQSSGTMRDEIAVDGLQMGSNSSDRMSAAAMTGSDNDVQIHSEAPNPHGRNSFVDQAKVTTMDACKAPQTAIRNSTMIETSTCKDAPQRRLQYVATCICQLREDDIDNHGFTYAPQSFHIGTHFVVTNGAYPDELSVWALQSGRSRRNRLGRSQSVEQIADHNTRLSETHMVSFGVDQDGVTDVHHGQQDASSSSSSSGSVNDTLPLPTTRSRSQSLPSTPTQQYRFTGMDGHDTHLVVRSRHLYAISETHMMQRVGVFIPPFRDVKHSRMDMDETMVISSVDYEGQQALFVWDYRVDRVRDRYFERCALGGRALWVCYEVDEHHDDETRGDQLDVSVSDMATSRYLNPRSNNPKRRRDEMDAVDGVRSAPSVSVQPI